MIISFSTHIYRDRPRNLHEQAHPRPGLTWIDQEIFIPLKQELYALSGMLLKTWTMSDAREFEGGRRFPSRMQVEDHVRRGSVTRIEFSEMRFGIELEDEVFSLRWLERR